MALRPFLERPFDHEAESFITDNLGEVGCKLGRDKHESITPCLVSLVCVGWTESPEEIGPSNTPYYETVEGRFNRLGKC